MTEFFEDESYFDPYRDFEYLGELEENDIDEWEFESEDGEDG